MKKIIKGWVHRPGKHCASTALSSISYFYGRNFSEPLSLGLGAGLGFYYMKGDLYKPTRALFTRSAGLEGNFFISLGMEDFLWNTDPDPDHALQAVQELVDQGVPVLIQTDIYFIDYYKSSTHFNGHVVSVWGYDDEKKVVLVGDTQWEGLQEIPYESLKKARTSNFFPFFLENNYFPARLDVKMNPLETAIPLALKKQAQELLPTGDSEYSGGVEGMANAIREMPGWKDLKDFEWIARFSYQLIERRGTGGGAFRLMYADFLKEAEEILPEMKKYSFSERMRQVARDWTEVSVILKEVSETKEVSLLEKAAGELEKVRKGEESIFSDILKIFPA
jgi:hypothetical protein